MGASNFAVEQGLVKTKINKAESYRRYTRSLVDKWIKHGKIKAVKIDGKSMFDVKELEEISSVNKLLNHFVNI
jgi:hypothetical protein